MKNLRYSLHQSLLSSALPLGLGLTSSPIADINTQGVTVWLQVEPCLAGDILLPVSIALLTSDPLGGGATTQFVCGPAMRLSPVVTNIMWALSTTALVCSALTAVLLFMKKQVWVSMVECWCLFRSYFSNMLSCNQNRFVVLMQPILMIINLFGCAICSFGCLLFAITPTNGICTWIYTSSLNNTWLNLDDIFILWFRLHGIPSDKCWLYFDGSSAGNETLSLSFGVW